MLYCCENLSAGCGSTKEKVLKLEYCVYVSVHCSFHCYVTFKIDREQTYNSYITNICLAHL